MAREKAASARLVALEVFCEKTGRNERIEIDAAYFTASDQECETCGSHGSIEVEFKCACGKGHTIEIRGW